MLPDYIDDPKHLPATDVEVRRAGDRLLCEVLARSRRKIRVPLYETDHPRTADRLRTLAVRLVARGKESVDDAPKGVAPGNADALLKDLGGINAGLDEHYADFLRRLASFVCVERVNPNRLPKCQGGRPHP